MRSEASTPMSWPMPGSATAIIVLPSGASEAASSMPARADCGRPSSVDRARVRSPVARHRPALQQIERAVGEGPLEVQPFAEDGFAPPGQVVQAGQHLVGQAEGRDQIVGDRFFNRAAFRERCAARCPSRRLCAATPGPGRPARSCQARRAQPRRTRRVPRTPR